MKMQYNVPILRRQEWLLILQIPLAGLLHYIFRYTTLCERMMGLDRCFKVLWPAEFLYWYVILAITGLIYWLMRDFKISRTLHMVHLLSLAIFPLMFFLFLATIISPQLMLAEHFERMKTECAGGFRFLRRGAFMIFLPLFLFFAVAQLVAVGNLIAGLIRGKKTEA